ncbi:transcription termination factor Rho [Candidatus Deianiraea vastatrix]
MQVQDIDPNEADFAYPPKEENTIIVKKLKEKRMNELNEMAEKYGVQNYHRMLRQDLITAILKQSVFHGKLIYSEGILEIGHDGHGFVRSQSYNYAACSDDIFISNNQIRKFGLRFGDQVAGYARVPKKGERYFSLLRLTEINGRSSDEPVSKVNFDNLTPLYPRERLNFECTGIKNNDFSTRVIDLISPIGKGQRALIVAQPKSGKTMLMQSIAHAIEKNHPEIYLIYLGIDERPEEFTEMQRTIKGEVVSSTFDEPAKRHVELAEIVIEKAKRLVEQGRDVVILLDSITRLARAYNNVMPSSGKILSGGVDSNALHRPKRFFGAARNIEEGGSLTIIATALVDTGSKMDEVIFEEFKGTGNSEIVLDRKIADRRVFPAIDILKSGTRKEEEMVSSETLTKMWMLRRILSGMGSGHEALEFLLKKIKETKDNEDFFKKMNGPMQ